MSNPKLVGLVVRPNLEATPGSESLGSRVAAGRAFPSQQSGRLRVRLTIGFLVTAIIPGLPRGPMAMATWGVIVLTSLFVHELGHALFGILWGSKATVILYPLGGITHLDPPLLRRRSIASLLAGPFLSLMVGLCIAAVRAKAGSPAWLSIAMWVNLGWGALNLIPVLPFDGGRVLVEALGERRATNALLVSASVAIGIAFSGLIAFRSLGLSFVFGAAALVSFMEWNKRRRVDYEAHLGLSWQLQLAKSFLSGGRPREARDIAETIIQEAKTQPTELAALEILAWSFLALGQPLKAREALLRGSLPLTVSAYCLAAIEDASGNTERALMQLEYASQTETLQPEALKLLIDLHARRGNLEQACQVALMNLEVLAPSDVRLVLDAAFADGSVAAATEIARALASRTHCPDDLIAEAFGLATLGQVDRSRAILAALLPPPKDWCPNQSARNWLHELCAHSDIADNLLLELDRAAR